MSASQSHVLDFRALDTTPGAPGPFAPPGGWNGPAEVYLRRIKEALEVKPDRKQQLGVAIRYANKGMPVGFVGPYAAQASELFDYFKDRAETSKVA